jgi:hypothetical protein
LIPDDPDERKAFALRIVAQRCLYGVDKNPLAAEMAKLSLWLLTLAKDKPFEFLDHAIRCGDSLVGIHSLDQLRKFNLDGKGEDNNLFLQFLDPKIKEAIALRRQITEMQANTVEDVEAQERMLREANEKIDRLKYAADMLISAEFVPGSAADKRAARDNAGIKLAVHFHDIDLATFRREAQKMLAGQVTFHWPLEYPEVVVERGGFDAFVGNPPFMGGSKITAALNTPYRDFIKKHLASGEKGKADLCAYFLLRASALAASQTGGGGLLATNSLGQGDNSSVGIVQLIERGASIYRAYSNRRWPGNASVTVAIIWFRFGGWRSGFLLDDKCVPGITATLGAETDLARDPFRLAMNTGQAFRGTEIKGEGFTLSAEEASSLVEREPDCRNIIQWYLTGEDLNSRFDQSPSRMVINFREMSFAEASRFPLTLALVTQRVKPYRDSITKQIHEPDYWKFWDKRIDCYESVRQMERVLARSRIANMHSIAFIPTGIVYSDKVVVFRYSEYGVFSCFQSSIHEAWARHFSGASLRTDMCYSTQGAFETFPFPKALTPPLTRIGETYCSVRTTLMTRRKEGLTTTYNRFHCQDESSADIQKLRQLHIEMDNAVAAAYGWTDLDLGHDFHETKQGLRYTISEPARREVLARLLNLNHERYAEEVKQGLHEKKKGSAKKPGAKKKAATPGKDEATLFHAQEDDE